MKKIIYLTQGRAKYVLNSLEGKAKALDDEGLASIGLTAIEVDIDSSIDLVALFHAGVICGTDLMTDLINQGVFDDTIKAK